MRLSSVRFALSVGMALIVVLFGFTLLSAAGLAGFAGDDALAEQRGLNEPDKQPEGPPIPKALATAPSHPLTSAQAMEFAAGDALFKNNCAQCHAVDEQVVGPALAGLSKRRPMSWIVPWVKNSGKMVASGDEYAVALFAKFNKQQMPTFALSDKEIASIVAYLNSAEGNVVAYEPSVAAR